MARRGPKRGRSAIVEQPSEPERDGRPAAREGGSPQQDHRRRQRIAAALVQSLEGAEGMVFQELWPAAAVGGAACADGKRPRAGRASPPTRGEPTASRPATPKSAPMPQRARPLSRKPKAFASHPAPEKRGLRRDSGPCGEGNCSLEDLSLRAGNHNPRDAGRVRNDVEGGQRGLPRRAGPRRPLRQGPGRSSLLAAESPISPRPPPPLPRLERGR